MKWDGVSRNRADYYRDFSDSERALNLSGSPSIDLVTSVVKLAETPCSPLKYESPRTVSLALLRREAETMCWVQELPSGDSQNFQCQKTG